jgi:hypothetical protein
MKHHPHYFKLNLLLWLVETLALLLLHDGLRHAADSLAPSLL